MFTNTTVQSYTTVCPSATTLTVSGPASVAMYTATPGQTVTVTNGPFTIQTPITTTTTVFNSQNLSGPPASDNSVVFTTNTVQSYTTVCPSATTLTISGPTSTATYIATPGQTITVTNGPFTIQTPVSTIAATLELQQASAARATFTSVVMTRTIVQSYTTGCVTSTILIVPGPTSTATYTLLPGQTVVVTNGPFTIQTPVSTITTILNHQTSSVAVGNAVFNADQAQNGHPSPAVAAGTSNTLVAAASGNPHLQSPSENAAASSASAFPQNNPSSPASNTANSAIATQSTLSTPSTQGQNFNIPAINSTNSPLSNPDLIAPLSRDTAVQASLKTILGAQTNITAFEDSLKEHLSGFLSEYIASQGQGAQSGVTGGDSAGAGAARDYKNETCDGLTKIHERIVTDVYFQEMIVNTTYHHFQKVRDTYSEKCG